MKKSLAPVFLIIGFLSFDLSAMAQTHYEPYTFTTLAGSSTAGTADGSGAAAQFQAPSGLAVDTGGTIYVADTENNTIRKVTQSGAVTTFAGSPGVHGSADGKGSAARFSSPSGIAVDTSGNVYVTDSNNSTIRKITPDATVSTLAGSPGHSGSADGTGSAARFSYLGHLAIDNSGNLIVADYGNQTIRKVTPAGVVTTLAGSPGVNGSADGPALQARFDRPRGIAVDSAGTIYISDEQNNTIRKIATDGTVSTLAGTANRLGGSNDGTGPAAQFAFPEGIAVDKAGNVYVSDSNNALIRKVTPSGVVTTLAGVPNTSGTNDGTGSGALFSTPYGMATDSFGTLYVGDCFGNNAIRVGTRPPPLDTNLLVNGDAELSPGGDYNSVAAPAGWTVTSGSLTVVRYDAAGGDPTLLNPSISSRVGGGNNFFAGGPNSSASEAQQVIDVSSITPSFDNGDVLAKATGLFGGYLSQGDTMQMTVAFFDSMNSTQPLSAFNLGAPSANDRQNTTNLLLSSARAFVPKGTRYIVVRLDAIRTDGNYNDGYADNLSLVLSTFPIPPAHGGLSTTIFRVNGSDSPTVSVCDTVLSFAAIQTGTPAGLYVRVQFTTTPTPNDATNTSWTNLPNGTGGSMVYDPSDQEFILTSANYPLVSNVYFRAISAASGYHPDSISNFVGPFDVTSTKPQIGSTRLDFTGNGNIADLYFRASESATVTGMSVRVQASTTPGDECSWSDLSNGTMTQSTDPKQLLLLVNNYPTTKGVCFRAIASASGYADSISNTMGPFDITAVIPPVVTVTTANPLPGSGDGHDPDHPIIVAVDNGAFAATVQSVRALKTVQLQVTGATVTEYPGSSDPNTVYIAYFTPTVGDHVYEAVAINEFGARARAGTGAIYVHVISSQSTAKAERTAGNAAATFVTNKVFHIVNSGGNWDDSSTWQDSHNDPGIPGGDDFAVIGASTVNIGGSVESVSSLSLNGGHIVGPGTLQIHGTMFVSGGSCDSFVHLIIKSGAVCQLVNNVDFHVDGLLDNNGTVNIHGSAGLIGAPQILNLGTINWLTPLQIPLNAATDPAAALRILQAPVTGNGVLSGGLTAFISESGSTILSNDGATLVAAGGGNIVSAGGGNIVSAGGGNIVSAGGGNIVSAGGGNIVAAGGGNIVSAGGGNFHSTSEMTAATAAAASPGYTQNGGETNLSACTIVGPVTLNGGVLSGTGFIQGDLTNNGGYISTGHSPGVMAVIGNFAQSANGTLIIKKGGPAPSQFDQLQVGGVASLGGKLDIKTINGYIPDPADTFSPLGYGSVSGSFSSISSNAQVTVAPTGLLTSIDPTKPNPTNGQPLNIATRLQIQSGDNVLIAGFIITGPAGSTKKVLIRGIGPSLANFGVAGTIPDPFLELHESDGSVVSNDNWQQAPNVAEIPSGFAPSNDLESIIYTSLSPGNYTAILKGAHGEAGVGLVEAYDFDSASTAKLGNIATRGFVNTADNVMIGGFIIGGTEPANVLVRAIGPSLIPIGVQGALQATTLELHDANGGVISNDGWRNTQESEIQATTIPPTNDNEAAILATLVPGNYTAIVRGKNDTTGIAVVEAYNLQ